MNKIDIESMLPEYVNGKLSADSAQEVEQAMKQDINIQIEVDFLKKLREAVKTQEVESPNEWGLARLRKSLSNHEVSIAKPPVKKIASWWKPLAVAASFAFILQTSYMLFNDNKLDDGYVPLATSESQNMIQVVFNSSITEMQLRALLTEVNAEIISGPSASGVYRIAAKNHETAIELLKASKLVKHVEKE